MAENPNIRIGHLKIVDHFILGLISSRQAKNDLSFSNLYLENIPMNSWNQVCDALNEGSVDGAFITIPAAMDLFASGLDIRLLMFTHRSGSILVRNNAVEIKTLSDFKGKTVLVPYDLSIQNMFFHQMLTSAGLSYGSSDAEDADVLKEIANPFIMPEMIATDHEADIGGYFVAEPFGSQAIDDGLASEICTSGSLWQDHPCCAFVLNNKTISESARAVEELVLEFFNTAQMIEKNKDDALVESARIFLDQNENVIRHVLVNSEISFDPLKLTPDIPALNIIQDYMVDTMGVMKNKIDIDDFVLNDYALKATSEVNIEN